MSDKKTSIDSKSESDDGESSGISNRSGNSGNEKDYIEYDYEPKIEGIDLDSPSLESISRTRIVSFDNYNAVKIEENEPVRHCKRELLQRFNKLKGRTDLATYERDNIHINHTKDHLTNKITVIEYEFQLKEPELTKPPRLRAVWLNQELNMKLHRTSRYQHSGIHNQLSVQQLVVRRGESFYLDLSFDQPFIQSKHSLTIILQFGQSNVCSSTSMICLRVNEGLKPNTWSAGIPLKSIQAIKLRRSHNISNEGDIGAESLEGSKRYGSAAVRSNMLNENKIQIQINSPSYAIIGKCMLTFDTALLTTEQADRNIFNETKLGSAEGKKNIRTESNLAEGKNAIDVTIMRHFYSAPIYLLCNPWKKEDQTYMSEQSDLAEYVENDNGFIYVGTKNQIKYVNWCFSQYENEVLCTAFHLLDLACLSHETRNDIAKVVRAICNNITSCEDSGVVSGNWSCSYAPYTAPSQWLGSLSIIENFLSSKEPTKYGHCYIFAAVATSLCRSIGIPCRCVTNYASAHDCDGTNKINLHWGIHGEPIDDLNTINFWAYHVWCEAYMKRPELLLNSYNGWQAFDPTPQLTSFGISCAGPCPVEAIRLGDMNALFDSRLIFSNIHAHQFHWILHENGQWRVIVEPRKAGAKIITHDPNPKRITEKDLCSPDITEIKIEAIDILDNYKFKQGTVLERIAMERADTKSVAWDVFDMGHGDVKFTVCPGDCVAGHIIGVMLAMQNLGTEIRHINITLTLYSIYYTGLAKHKIKTMSFSVELNSLSKQRVMLRAIPEEYCWYMSDNYILRVYAKADVPLTSQVFCTMEDYCLKFPDIEFEVVSQEPKITVSQNITVNLRWGNPLPIDLRNCVWTVLGEGLIKFTRYKIGDIEPLGVADLQIPLRPDVFGDLHLHASFYSDQTPFAKGSKTIKVHEVVVFVDVMN